MGFNRDIGDEKSSNADFSNWLEKLEDLGEERGYFEPLGARHSVVLSDSGTTLLVTFETAASIRSEDADGRPLGWRLTEDNGWSNLCLIAHDDTWFRDPAVFGYFDRLVDDGFFEDFDRVVFYGAGMGGYAAAAFSLVAPDATVLAIAPQATLDPACAGWDKRFPKMRRTSFTDRYGYAPDMCENAEQVFIIHDPEIREDAMHVALFSGENITLLHCRLIGPRLEHALVTMKILPLLIEAAAAGTLDAATFSRLYRARRRYFPYLRRLLDILETAKRPQLVLWLANSVVKRLKAPRFHKARMRALGQIKALRQTQK